MPIINTTDIGFHTTPIINIPVDLPQVIKPLIYATRKLNLNYTFHRFYMNKPAEPDSLGGSGFLGLSTKILLERHSTGKMHDFDPSA